MKRRLIFAAAAFPLLLGACGTDVTPAPTPAVSVTNVSEITAGATYNDTDVMFLQMLIDNQEQGQQMARIAAERATRPEIVALAEAVQVTQADELKLMKSWLDEWNRPTVLDKRVSLHADHGGMPSTGDEEIASLKTIKKAQFETAFLNLFLAHQHNAVEFAQLELDKGTNTLSKSFAERVKQSRTDQVQQMLKLLAG
ncbi:Uncharacterized conserved protein, DUF305 family [Actinoplanes derwentensis]|uniref:Uncharacterized conserved protein, DUF305 family n=1 Tax=Actinoplanes derwentensis TaxID=113562 RepID=A0A1H2CX20_9ACTN|nr:DUF305 domain-containing protein [Actinoplanes derwentensis]SDT75011.1 Uncharacterized conserved protein, DUF305 family [Actinoplanes derwentensis]